ncbi:DUF2182 domain-containing protein [Natrinema salifodinae]|uniref:Predicted metal-binding membrane protein n=1 Tax=Natrinema salifodinae TaxID=1202768 RepID=A0A1I0NMF6_9EURY|nr:DUF2182 domain-containing protein [Natrinema salifodinae]SEW02055.1 Predicted metal-binding membrane protein [Natrinema salifodinae]
MVPDVRLPFTTRIDRDSVPVAETLVLSLSALLWFVLRRGWLPGPGPVPDGLDAPMSAPGVPEAAATANGLAGALAYLLLWGAMMLTMMLPSLLPAVRRYRDELCDAPSVFGPSIAAFVGAYGLVWTLAGAVPLAVDFLLSIRGLVTATIGGVDAGALALAGLFAFAGAYQFTSLKRDLLARCARCRSIPHRPGVRRMAREGVEYAANCVGCTWPLFAAMVALGSMNHLVMVGLTLVVALERLAANGEDIAVAWGVVLLGAAAVALLSGVLGI